MTNDQITALLVRRILGWRVGPDRFLKGRRRWTSRWRFQPLRRMDQALELLEGAGSTYSFEATGNGSFTARVVVGGRTGQASGRSKAATVTVALARAIGIDAPDELLEGCE